MVIKIINHSSAGNEIFRKKKNYQSKVNSLSVIVTGHKS